MDTGKLATVKNWFRIRQIYEEGISNYPEFGEIERETEKAYLLNTEFGHFWAPKKCVDLVD